MVSGNFVVRDAWSTSRIAFLTIASIALPIGMSVWQALLNNFAVEHVGFTGLENGIMQSIREIPGLLAFTAIFVLLVLREQTFALLALALFGVGISITGIFPNAYALYFAVVVMSVGFHYFETIRQSLALQWLPKSDAPRQLGRLIRIGAMSGVVTYCLVWCALELLRLPYAFIYGVGGGAVIAITGYMALKFPFFRSQVEQRKQIVLRSRYWLYYGLTFLSGARRQIFVAFAGFLLVQKFAYSAAAMTVLLLVNHLVNWLFAEKIGALIGRIGERRALSIEYTGLVLVFTSYAFVQSEFLAGALYVLDHLLFAMAIGIKTYFQKIADPADIASTAGVSFTINHIAAVVIPVVLGAVWLTSPAAVFLVGAAFAASSLLLSQFIPRDPAPGTETTLSFATSMKIAS